MLLHILRHGEADNTSLDADRSLTDRGRADVAEVIMRHSIEWEYFVIQASPLLRAQQTASIVQNHFSDCGEIETNENVAPWGNATEFVRSINDSGPDTLIASHQPFVSDLVYYLSEQNVSMPTATLVTIQLDQAARGCGSIVEVTRPK